MSIKLWKWGTVLLWNWVSRELTMHQKRMSFNQRSTIYWYSCFFYVLVIFPCSLWRSSERLISFENPLLQFCFLILLLKFSLPVWVINPKRKTNTMAYLLNKNFPMDLGRQTIIWVCQVVILRSDSWKWRG